MEQDFWQAYKNKGVQVIGVDVWNGSNSQVQNYAQGSGRNVTYPLGLNGGPVGNQWGLDRSSYVIIGANGLIEYISPQSTSYSQRFSRHSQEMKDKIDQLISVSHVSSNSGRVPQSFKLFQNSPNPFSRSTSIRFNIEQGMSAPLQLAIYDILGRKVRTVLQKTFSPGLYSINWTGSDDSGARVPGGVYFYVLETGRQRLVKKMLFIP
jgi:hypothetical protein